MITVEAAFEEFLMACRADGLKPITIRWYRAMLTPVAATLAGLPVDQVTVNHLRAYVVRLRERPAYQDAPQRAEQVAGLSAASLQSHHRALSRFFGWCKAEYALTANPIDRIRMPKTQRKEPKAVDLADLKRLLEATGDDRQGIRDRAILLFLADTGCRVGGLLGLKPADVDLNYGRAVVYEKGDKTRVVPFTRFTAQMIRTWLTVRPSTASTLFCGLSNQKQATPLTYAGVYQILLRLKRKAGVQGRVNPHSFRHGFAREYLINGGDLATLAQLMGHTNVQVTASFYAIFTMRELEERHHQFSPIAKWEAGGG